MKLSAATAISPAVQVKAAPTLAALVSLALTPTASTAVAVSAFANDATCSTRYPTTPALVIDSLYRKLHE